MVILITISFLDKFKIDTRETYIIPTLLNTLIDVAYYIINPITSLLVSVPYFGPKSWAAVFSA
jgi:hypothetical protein